MDIGELPFLVRGINKVKPLVESPQTKGIYPHYATCIPPLLSCGRYMETIYRQYRQHYTSKKHWNRKGEIFGRSSRHLSAYNRGVMFRIGTKNIPCGLCLSITWPQSNLVVILQYLSLRHAEFFCTSAVRGVNC